jgi:hypothetical protein
MLARPISATETELTLLSNTDPFLAIVPYRFLNSVTKQFAYMLMYTLANLAENIEGTEYEKRILKNKDIYEDARQRIKSHFENTKKDENVNEKAEQ